MEKNGDIYEGILSAVKELEREFTHGKMETCTKEIFSKQQND